MLLCHRCGAELLPELRARFCPQCGAPQLVISDALASEPDGDASTTGIAPPPRPRLIEWRRALRSAWLVTGIMLVLFLVATRIPALTLFWLLWTGSGSLIVLELYGRRHFATRMNAAIGARIGAATGLLMAATLCVALAGTGVVVRFMLHGMGDFDRDLHQRMAEQIHAAVAANPGAAELASGQILPGLIAGSLLLGLGMGMLFLFAVSVLGGALGGLIQQRRIAVR